MELIGSDISLLTKTLVKDTWKKVFAMELNDLGREGSGTQNSKKKTNSVNKIETQKTNEKTACDRCGKTHTGKCKVVPCAFCIREKRPEWLARKHTEEKCWHKNPALAPDGWVSRPQGTQAAPPDGVQAAISMAPSSQQQQLISQATHELGDFSLFRMDVVEDIPGSTLEQRQLEAAGWHSWQLSTHTTANNLKIQENLVQVLEQGNKFNITHLQQRSCKTSFLDSANSLTPSVTDRGQALQWIEASAHVSSDRFDIPLFCDTGASIDITSAATARKRGVHIDFKDIPQKIVDVQGKSISLLGTATFFLHHEGYVRRLVVTVAENLGRDDEIVISLGTLRKLGKIEEIFPKINPAKFAEGTRAL